MTKERFINYLNQTRIMSLTDTIKEVVEEANKRKNKQDIWKTLEEKLKKEKSIKKEFNNLIHEIDNLEAYKILKVWDAVDEHLNKKKHGLGYRAYRTFNALKELAKIDYIEEVIKTLGDSSFEMPTYRDILTYTYLDENHVKFFGTLAKDELYKKYGPLSKALNKLGYKGINNYSKPPQNQIEHFITTISLKGDVEGAMYVLAANGYKIDESAGLDYLDIKNVKKVIEEDEKEKLEGKGGIPIYLYNTGNAELFQDYFNGLEIEKKKSILRSILDYETKDAKDCLLRGSETQIRCWLEKDYENLIREIGFED